MLITCSANNLISSSTKHLCVRRYGEGYVSVCVVCVYVHLAVCVHMCVCLHVRVHACVCMRLEWGTGGGETRSSCREKLGKQ